MVAGAVVAAGKWNVIHRAGKFTEQNVGSEEFAAAREKPAELVEGDVVLAGFDHQQDFFEVFGAITGRARVDEDPAAAISGAAQAEAIGRRLLGTAAIRFAFGQQRDLSPQRHDEHDGRNKKYVA